MGAIYKDAKHILISLGRLEDHYSLFFRDLNDGHDLKVANQSVELRKGIQHQLLAIYNLPYWSRLWIVQEILLTRGTRCRKVAIFSGQELIDFDHLYSPILLMTWTVGQSAWALLSKSQYHTFGQYSICRQTCDRLTIPAPLAQLLITLRQDCRDKRDRVFALLSLWNDTSSIDVNYHMSTEALFQHVLQNYVRGKSLDDYITFGAILVESLELRGPKEGRNSVKSWDCCQVSSQEASIPAVVVVGKPIWMRGYLINDVSDGSEDSRLQVACMFVLILDNGCAHLLEYAVENFGHGIRVRYARLHEYVHGFPNLKHFVDDGVEYSSGLPPSTSCWLATASEDSYYYCLEHQVGFEINPLFLE
jgi:hypothetical protein